MENGIRINKYLSICGYCSRRAADVLIEEGRVKVDDLTALCGTRVTEGQNVTVDGVEVSPVIEKKVYAFYKPAGYISSLSDEQGEGISRFIPAGMRLYPAGRLDKESEGLMLLTNDGGLMNEILNAAGGHEKEYAVTTREILTDKFLKQMSEGVPITNGATGKKVITAPCITERINEHKFSITIIQGLNRQIRRMCGYFGYHVDRLRRIRIMNISIGGLIPGQIRELDEAELKELKKSLNQENI